KGCEPRHYKRANVLGFHPAIFGMHSRGSRFCHPSRFISAITLLYSFRMRQRQEHGLGSFAPMPLLRAREPFDHPEWLFELKHDGFRALAFANGGGTRLVSRRGLEYRRFDDLYSEMSLGLNADDAVVDGEIVKLDSEGRPVFIDLMRRRGPFVFVAFDCRAVNGRDIRRLPLLQRKKLLR